MKTEQETGSGSAGMLKALGGTGLGLGILMLGGGLIAGATGEAAGWRVMIAGGVGLISGVVLLGLAEILELLKEIAGRGR